MSIDHQNDILNTSQKGKLIIPINYKKVP
jgi:hypothetical protein